MDKLSSEHQKIVDFAVANFVGVSTGDCEGKDGEVRNFKEQVITLNLVINYVY